MKRVAILVAAVLAVGLVAQASGASSSGKDVLEFDTMVGVSGVFVGAANPIRNVPGGGLPWQIEKGEGELRSDGSLKVEVEGLVLLDAAPVPEALQGTNPIAAFAVVVSCLTTGNVVSNVSTGTFPATTTGDAKIRATVTLPSPCFAPILFVTSPGGAWFAVTGV